MKYLYTLFLISSIGITLSAQMSCDPDPFYTDSTGGVYPRPVSEAFPDAGIDEVACPGQEYFFNFTVNVPDTILFGGTPIGVERVSLRTDNPVTGLPSGITFVCNPSDCDMAKNTQGCIALVGTVDAGVTPGVYPLEILVNIVTSLGISVPTQFPNAAIAPGEYFIVVGEPDGQGGCLTVSLIETLSDQPLSLFPNPAREEVRIIVPNKSIQKATVTVFDVLGKPVIHAKEQVMVDGQCNISTSQLSSGTYFVNIADGNQRYQAKLVIQD